MTLEVENIKCHGCANSIKSALEALTKSRMIEVDIEQGIIQIEDVEGKEAVIINKLRNMGYPLRGKGNTLTTAKSYVSCMVGKFK